MKLIPSYFSASHVSFKIVQFLSFLVEKKISSLDRVNIVGHSMGAHIAGLAGKKLPKNGKYGQIQRIIALDPAAPGFWFLTEDKRFTPSDAVYTEGRLCLSDEIELLSFYFIVKKQFILILRCLALNIQWLELISIQMEDNRERNKTYNFIFIRTNYWSRQPGCLNIIFSSSSSSSSGTSNSHSRAWEYFAESIESNDFVAQKCLNYEDVKQGICRGEGTAIMGGEPGNMNLDGLFYLKTNRTSPYAKGLCDRLHGT